uniref:Uncharacterized protein n=1 Tax=Zea mays TaxID=4577 RepID=B6SPS4_MAIZE|nr:hypothetical protein [Zea mays]
MASSVTRTACLLVLTLFVVSAAVILPSSLCHGARGVAGLRIGLDPNHPACIGACPAPGGSYTHLPPYRGGGPVKPLPPPNGGNP